MQNNLTTIEDAKKAFETACESAYSIQISQTAASAFNAVIIVNSLREILTDDIMKEVFMPLMNTKIGFLTDKTGRPDRNGVIKKPYDISIVRDAIIDGICFGLLPTGNQINIISERMYPTKEGYTALLKKAGIKYHLSVGIDRNLSPYYAEIPVKIDYEYKDEKHSFPIAATVKKDTYSSHDQLRGKAERRAKKQLYEYITGCDLGDADEYSSTVTDAEIVKKDEKTVAQKKTTLRIKKAGQHKIELA